MPGVGTLNEGPLHAALKDWYRQPGDLVEQPVDGFVIDLVRGEELIEIQTGGFSAIRRKLDHLLDAHPIRLVHPIAERTFIVKIDERGHRIDRRRSPKRGRLSELCLELVSFPTLLSHPHFTLEVPSVVVDEVRRRHPGRSRRRGGWYVDHRRLVEIAGHTTFREPGDLLDLLPTGLPDEFTTAELAALLPAPRRVAQALAYCLGNSDQIVAVGRNARGVRYRRVRSLD